MKQVTIYLKSGQTMALYCDSAKFVYDGVKQTFISYEVIRPDRNFQIDPAQIVAWEQSK